MTPQERSAKLARLSTSVASFQPLIDWILTEAEQSRIEHAEFFAKLRKAKAGDPAATKILLACIDEIEEADPSERADILKAIRVRGKRGRSEGPTEIGEAYTLAAQEVIRRTAAGEKQADVIAELAPALPGLNTTLESKRTQLRDRVREERRRRSLA
ncbi:hypothetical protein D3C73_05750 [compost metagenome]